MCGLCGLLEGSPHWSEVINSELPLRQQRYARIAAINQVLVSHRLRLEDFQGSGYVLASPTGHQEMIANIDELWTRAEALSGTTLDPLDSELLIRLEYAT
ncbi:hypothetical protein [Salinicola peritrichatus]|uniref:hypothetical protein n=1 Tax=Salinicola peritrichatus TaxID=1267424 RepID=UPI000DA1B047|nr:hypothetical protein [Salinicola peritrichatus]